MDTKFTKGDWKFGLIRWTTNLNEPPGGFYVHSADSPLTDRCALASGNCAERRNFSNDYTSEEIEANARLIAAAPNMYAALTPFAALLHPHHANMSDDRPVFSINGSHITAGDLRMAIAALSKASGA